MIKKLITICLVFAWFSISMAGTSASIGTDSGTQLLGGDPFFHYRSTGLATNIIEGNPTYDMLWNKGFKGIGASMKSLWVKDYDFSESQYNKLMQLLIFQNTLGIQNVIRKIGDTTLPERP